MAFHVTVKGGEDDGKSFKVDGQTIAGRSPDCSIRLTDPSVSWEHAALHDRAGRLVVQAISAAGLRVNGETVTSEGRLASGDRIELTDTCSLVVAERIGAEEKRRSGYLLPVTLLLVLLVGAFGIGQALDDDEVPVPAMTIDHWRTAHRRLVDRMTEWQMRGEFPAEAEALFQDAFRLEVAGNRGLANERWETLRAVLLTLQVPGENHEGLSFAEAASTGSRSLEVIMDWATDTSLSMNPTYRTDAAYADALFWFVNRRANSSRQE